MFRIDAPGGAVASGAFFGPAGTMIAATLGLVLLGIAAVPKTSGQTVNVYYSSADGTYKLSQQPNLTVTAPNGSNVTAIGIDTSATYQTMLGIGTSMEDTSIYNLSQMDATTRQSALTNLFSPGSGIGLDVIRVPFGTPDFTATPSYYSYDDMPSGQTDPTLAHFSIQNDVNNNIISVLQQALSVNPKIKIFASVWSPPGWLKDNDSLIDGNMLDSNVNVYASYLVKAIQAYQAQGIPIYAISVQNEPNWCNNTYTQTCWTWEVERDEVNAVKSAFASAGITTKVWIGDMDYVWWNTFDEPILADSTAGPKVDGVAFHPYTGSPSDMTSLHNAYPNVPLYMTERGWDGMSIATYSIPLYENWASLFANWVAVVNQNGGPALGPYTALNGGLIEVNTSNYNSPTYTAGYYILGQFSKFSSPGAVRINSDPGASGTVTDVAFMNPTGQIEVAVENATTSSQSFKLLEGGGQISDTLPANTVGTYLWTPNIGSGFQYRLINQTSGMCLANGGSTQDGTQIEQSTCDSPDASQNWSLVSMGNGEYHVVNQTSGKCLDDTNGSTSDGTLMQQWGCYPGSNQNWSLVNVGNNQYHLVNQTSGMCLDDTNGSISPGTLIQQWSCYSGSNQNWAFNQH